MNRDDLFLLAFYVVLVVTVMIGLFIGTKFGWWITGA
jgi:hypothetical protein